MESFGRVSGNKLAPYINVDSELLSTTRKQSMLSRIRGSLNLYCSEESCDFETSKINSLRNHLMMHLGKVPYMCNICGEHFERNDNAMKHFKQVHTEQWIRNILKLYFPKNNKCEIIYKSENSFGAVHK